MSCSQVPDPIRRRAVLAAGCGLGLVMCGSWGPVRAATVDAQTPTIELEPDGAYASATVVFALPRALEETLHRGVPLYFSTRLEVLRPRWWWFDETVSEARSLTRLGYEPLLDKFRVSTGALRRSYASLDEALNQVQHVLHLKIADARDLKAGQSYDVAGRFELDLSQLPRPFQINVSSQTDWQLQADFPRTSFVWTPPQSTASPG